MTIIKPRPQVLTTWRLLLALGSAPLALAISFFLSGWLYTLATILWFVGFLGTYLFYHPRLYDSLLYILNDNVLTVRRGVFYHRIYNIPLHTIQFTTLTISPFSRLFGLVTLKVVSPGARVSLSGMSLGEARLLAKEIASLKEQDHDGT